MAVHHGGSTKYVSRGAVSPLPHTEQQSTNGTTEQQRVHGLISRCSTRLHLPSRHTRKTISVHFTTIIIIVYTRDCCTPPPPPPLQSKHETHVRLHLYYLLLLLWTSHQTSVAQASSTENVITLRGSTDVVTDFFYYAVNRWVRRRKAAKANTQA